MDGEILEVPADSFRTAVEGRLAALESNQGGADSVRIGEAGADTEGNSLAGIVRTCEARVSQAEGTLAENTSAILRLTDLVKSLADQVKALQPPTQ